MSLYDLPSLKIKIPQKIIPKFLQPKILWLLILVIFTSSVFGFLAGIFSSSVFIPEIKENLARWGIIIPEEITDNEKALEYVPQTTQEEKTIEAVNGASPAVVSIVITKDMPIFEQYYINPFEGFDFQIPQYSQKGTEKKEIGGGTGFIVSAEGIILTNKHVVSDAAADYTVLTNDGKKFPAKVLAKDLLQDLALLKIEADKSIDKDGNLAAKPFPVVKLGDSDQLQLGQTVITIGNALGEFRNTISVGVISGLGRTITASGGGLVETIEDVIQTDAAINQGNSGGPLLNLKGEVVGINTATVLEAQNIGFAIPVNKAKKDIEQIQKLGKIVYPFLGIRYTIIDETVQQDNNLTVDYGAWVMSGQGQPAITSGSAAEKAGLRENDIILEFNGEKITIDNSLAKILQKYNPGDKITLKILRDKKELNLSLILGERTE